MLIARVEVAERNEELHSSAGGTPDLNLILTIYSTCNKLDISFLNSQTAYFDSHSPTTIAEPQII